MQGRRMVGRNYLARQAETLLMLAKTTTDPQVVAALVEMAASVKSKVDKPSAADPTPVPPDVEHTC
jgi:hypothetical protein